MNAWIDLGGQRMLILGHAAKRMRERLISEADVVLAFREPDMELAARDGAKTGAHRVKHVKRIGGRRIFVVLEKSDKLVVVITAWATK